MQLTPIITAFALSSL